MTICGKRSDAGTRVTVDGVVLTNIAASLSPSFGWGHRGLSTQALAVSLARQLGIEEPGRAEILDVLRQIQTDEWTLTIEQEG